jgi:hypothetical protein
MMGFLSFFFLVGHLTMSFGNSDIRPEAFMITIGPKERYD